MAGPIQNFNTKVLTLEQNPLLSVFNAVKQIVCEVPDAYHIFESHYRDLIAASDLSCLTSGHLSFSRNIEVIQISLDYTCDYIFQNFGHRYDNILSQLYGPLIHTLFSVLRTVNNSKQTTSAVNKTPSRQSSIRSSTPESSKKVKQKPSKMYVPVTKSQDEINVIHAKLERYLKENPQPYNNPQHKHIVCDKENCTFCRSAFRHIHLTRCEGHESCDKSGWFPHIGKTLWKLIHRNHQDSREFVGSTNPCKLHELPALAISADVSSRMTTLAISVGEQSPRYDGCPSYSWAEECATPDELKRSAPPEDPNMDASTDVPATPSKMARRT